MRGLSARLRVIHLEGLARGKQDELLAEFKVRRRNRTYLNDCTPWEAVLRG